MERRFCAMERSVPSSSSLLFSIPPPPLLPPDPSLSPVLSRIDECTSMSRNRSLDSSLPYPYPFPYPTTKELTREFHLGKQTKGEPLSPTFYFHLTAFESAMIPWIFQYPITFSYVRIRASGNIVTAERWVGEARGAGISLGRLF